jgi:glycosyltransferase involved in cell wall biosynthesis
MTDKRKTILFMTPGFPIGGAETFLINLINNYKTKIKPIVISLGAGSDLTKKIDPEISVIEFKRKWKYDLSIIGKLKAIIVQHNIEAAFVISFFPFFFLRYAVDRKLKPMNIFISLHSTKPKSFKEYIQGLVYARMLNDNEKLVTVCKNQVKYLSKMYRIDLKMFDTIYNGVDTNHFTIAPKDFDKKMFRAKYQIPDDANVILQVAGFRKEKKHDDSIKALKIIHTNYNIKPYLLFVGGGDATRELNLRDLASQYQLTEYVKFCGKQNDVRPFCWVSDLFTLSSTSIETFSIAALEAMACGLPGVLTNIGGANEMISDGVNGYLVQPGKPAELAGGWIKVIENRDKLKPMNIRQKIIDNFSLDEMLVKYEKLLGIS